MTGIIKVKKRTAANDVRRQLLRKMKAGYFKNNQLPSEAGVADMFGVSRITVRDALAILENQKYISRAQGKETRINTGVCDVKNRVSEGLLFTEIIKSYGLKPSIRNCVAEKHRMDDETRKLLNSRSRNMYSVEKTFLGDGKPIIFSINVFSEEYIDDRILDYPKEDMIIFKWIVEEFDFPAIAYDKIVLEPIVADEFVSERLEIPVGTPMLKLVSVAMDYNEKPLLVNYEYYNPEYVTFQEIRAVDYQMED